jgi:hypothetical protein
MLAGTRRRQLSRRPGLARRLAGLPKGLRRIAPIKVLN